VTLVEADLVLARKLTEALMARKGQDAKVRDVRIDERAGTVVFTTVDGIEMDLPIADFIGLYG